MKQLIPILTAAAFASCSAAPEVTPDPSPVAEPATEEQPTESPAAATPATPATEEVPTCPTLTDEAAFARWREQLMAKVNTNDLAAAKRVLQCAQPAFSAELFEQSEEWIVDATPRHLDADPDEEWVLQFRQHSPVVGHGERYELVWLALFDKKDGKYQSAGVIVRPRHLSCVIADDEGITIDFGEDIAGDDAGMVLTEQDVKACGTLVDVAYTKTIHKLELGKLVSLPLKAPKAKSWNRTEGATQ